MTRVSKWVLHVLSQDSSSSWESRVEEKRGGIAISLHHSQIIPVPEIKCFISKSSLWTGGGLHLGLSFGGKRQQ